jgi:Flp pilus assembly pilin Flp
MRVSRPFFSWSRLARDRRGAAAMEYALIIALIALALLGALQALDASLLQRWTVISDWMNSAS